MKNNKERLFEMMSKVDKSFKLKLNEEYQTSISEPEYTSTSTEIVPDPTPEENNNTNQLKIIPQTPDGSSIPYDENDSSSIAFSYLHGDLEEKAGYDKFVFIGEIPTDGVHPATVMFSNGDVDSLVYIWTIEEGGTNERRGLVVRKGDTVAMEDAQRKYDTKTSNL